MSMTGWNVTANIGFLRSLLHGKNDKAKVLVRVNGALFHIAGVWVDELERKEHPYLILDLGVPYDFANPDAVVRPVD